MGDGRSNGRGVVVFSKDKRPTLPRKRRKEAEEAEEAAAKVVKPRGAASVAPHHKPGELARPTERASVPQVRAGLARVADVGSVLRGNFLILWKGSALHVGSDIDFSCVQPADPQV